ncbi:helix-turn-helix domain-containing protein [Nitrococcus mobilis]|uniref:DNA-binding protein n=1 Tax=Nitrococcus mobilis Nb-231 TaxID=314278 RepID=A4BLD6_9GAMM|nr:helix-turn-helix domain-containing protein [Nitrococcus mobilis]EAR23124.1 DNA-binding protein [Nitrococcus mobilis Nb-231]
MTSCEAMFTANWVSPPGETIADLLEEKDWSQAELAKRLGYTAKHVSQLINGKVPLTDDTALRLERVLGGGVSFWMSREAQYQEQLARLAARERLGRWTGWLDELPTRELMKAGAISKRRLDAKNKPAVIEELLRFFGVASPDEWLSHYVGMQIAYRRTREEQSDTGAISAWLRLGEIEAEHLAASKYDKARFVATLRKIRALTVLPPEVFEPQLRALCRAAGVTFVLVPALPRAHVSGVARWLNSHRPLIQLSLYGKSNDRFWFTFFHEAAHILLHGKEAVFLDELVGDRLESVQEREADEWAQDALIPREYINELPFLRSKGAVRAFADRIGVHPGIVVGRLQHDAVIPRSWMNDLKDCVQLQSPAVAESG